MELQITLDDLATLVTTKHVFKQQIGEEVNKYIHELENNMATLKEQFATLQTALSNQDTAIKTEFDQVKAKLEALHNENITLQDAFNALKLELDAVKDSIEGVDLEPLIADVDASIAKIDAISESDVPPADTTPPAIPTGLVSSNLTDTSVDLAWDADADVAVYHVFQDGNEIGTSTDAAFSVTGLETATTYSFAVSGEDAAGNVSSTGDALEVTTL